METLKQKPDKNLVHKLGENVLANWFLYLMVLIGLAIIFLIMYVPLFGLVVSFQDYKPQTGFLSEWVGFRNFNVLFQSPVAVRLIRNTVFLNLIFLISTTLSAIILALLLNDIDSKWYKSISQSIMILPFFVSWSVIAVLMEGLINPNFGVINLFVRDTFGVKVDFYQHPEWWPWILMLIQIWKESGASCVIYLAVLTNINPELYEAAAIDGASRLKRMRFISIPLLVPTMLLLVLLSVGRIFYGNWGMIWNTVGRFPNLYATTDVIETYLLRALRTSTNFGMVTAIGLIQAVLGFLFIYGSNWLARKYSQWRGEEFSLF